MGKNDKLDKQFGVLSNDEIAQCSELSKALEMINKEGIITDVNPTEIKQFIVKKNEDIKSLTKMEMIEKNDVELDEISNQADTAFEELMNIAINSTGKAVGEISSAAQSFLTIKLSAKMAKTEMKLKKMNYDLQEKKLKLQEMKMSEKDDDSDDNNWANDGIEIITK